MRHRNDLKEFLLALAAGTLIGVTLLVLFSRVQAAASVNNLQMNIQQIDSSGVPILNRQVPAVSFSGSVGVFTNSILVNTNPASQTLPTTTVLQFYFKNTSTLGGITVTWTPSGGGSNVVKKVGAGGVLVFWETVSGNGITALSLQSDTVNETYEMFLGG